MGSTSNPGRIREAIASEDYGTALLLWEQYAAELGNEFSAERLAETRELVEWSRSVLLCARAHNLDRLNALHAARIYAARGG